MKNLTMHFKSPFITPVNMAAVGIATPFSPRCGEAELAAVKISLRGN